MIYLFILQILFFKKQSTSYVSQRCLLNIFIGCNSLLTYLTISFYSIINILECQTKDFTKCKQKLLYFLITLFSIVYNFIFIVIKSIKKNFVLLNLFKYSIKQYFSFYNCLLYYDLTRKLSNYIFPEIERSTFLKIYCSNSKIKKWQLLKVNRFQF